MDEYHFIKVTSPSYAWNQSKCDTISASDKGEIKCNQVSWNITITFAVESKLYNIVLGSTFYRKNYTKLNMFFKHHKDSIELSISKIIFFTFFFISILCFVVRMELYCEIYLFIRCHARALVYFYERCLNSFLLIYTIIKIN